MSIIAVFSIGSTYASAETIAANLATVINEVGLFTGTLENGSTCSIDIFEISRSLISRRPKYIDAIITAPNVSERVSLECDYSLGEGVNCKDMTYNLAIHLMTGLGSLKNVSPDFDYWIDQELVGKCQSFVKK